MSKDIILIEYDEQLRTLNNAFHIENMERKKYDN